jgi:nucleoside-diphosphate-sugar epimerase
MGKIKKVLITGGLGHIGSYLARTLNDGNNEREYVITILDNFMTSRYCSLFNMEDTITFVENSIDSVGVNFLNQFDVVYHSAAVTDAADSFKNKSQLESVNIEQTKIFIDQCLNAEIKRFIFPSSTSVYGVATHGTTITEDDVYVNPQSPYAEAKIEIEEYIREKFMGTTMSSYTIFRFGTIHGMSPGMRFHTAVNKFCYQASLGIPLTVWKENYKMVRPYLSLVDALGAIQMSIDWANLNDDTYNVLTKNYSLEEIINYISIFSPHKINIEWVDTPLLNQHSYNVSQAKIIERGLKIVGHIKEDIKDTMNLLRNLK